MKQENALVVFEGKQIRRIWHNDQWYFSIVDVISVLTDSPRPRKYWSDLKNQLLQECFELSDFIGQLKLLASDGKYYETDCANTETMFRKLNFFNGAIGRTAYLEGKTIESSSYSSFEADGTNQIDIFLEKIGYKK